MQQRDVARRGLLSRRACDKASLYQFTVLSLQPGSVVTWHVQIRAWPAECSTCNQLPSFPKTGAIVRGTCSLKHDTHWYVGQDRTHDDLAVSQVQKDNFAPPRQLHILARRQQNLSPGLRAASGREHHQPNGRKQKYVGAACAAATTTQAKLACPLEQAICHLTE